MRVLVTGAAGLLGRVLVEDLAAANDVTALVRTRKIGKPGVREQTVDLTHKDRLASTFDESRPDLVIHTAAITTLEGCADDPGQAMLMNAEIAGDIAELCARNGSRLIHVSTDAVFDGTAGPYAESDIPNPQSEYAATKLAGEYACLAALPEALVARVNFFGWSLSGTRSLAEFFYNSLSSGKRVRGYTDVHFATLYNRDLVQVLVDAASRGICGVRHVVSSDSMSKFDFGRLVADVFGFDPELVVPSSMESQGSHVRRTHALTLSPQLLASELGGSLPTIRDGIQHMQRDLKSGYVRTLRSEDSDVRPTTRGSTP